MTKIEKVIYSLERCTCHAPDACRDCAYDDKDAPDCWSALERDALELLKENAAPVVRCKDCKYSKPIPRKHSFLCDHDKPYASYLREPDWFCANGERREDDAKEST